MTLIAHDDDVLISKALARGAQGYLTKNAFNSNLVPQALRNLIRHKAADQEYFNEKARAEIALNSIGDAVLCTNLLGNVEYLNIAAETLTGWSREEARGKPISEVFKLINGLFVRRFQFKNRNAIAYSVCKRFSIDHWRIQIF